MESFFPGLKPSPPLVEFPHFDFPEDNALHKAAPHCSFCSTIDADFGSVEEFAICPRCGEIKERFIETGAEYRYFANDDKGSSDPCRVGAPSDARFPSSSLGTIILGSSGSGAARNAMNRVRRYQTWNMLPYNERSLLHVYELFAIAATNNGIDQHVIENAKLMYKQLLDHCKKRGLSHGSILASCLYASLKQVGQPRKPKEIAEMFHLTTGKFTKSYKSFQEILAVMQQRGLLQMKETPSNIESTCAADYIQQPLSKLGIPREKYEETVLCITKLCNFIEENEISPENMPPSLAAGVISYVLAKRNYEQISQTQIATVCGISQGTLQKCVRRLETNAKRLADFDSSLVVAVVAAKKATAK